MNLESTAATDIGKIRRSNEDRYIHDRALGLFGVADGIGGLPGGAEAAQRAVETVLEMARESDSEDPLSAHHLALAANEAVGALGERISPDTGIGTTLTLGWFRDGKVELVNVGDSRCYRLRKRDLTCLTVDDSVENEVRRRRERGEQVFLHESQRNALTQCIGQPMPLGTALTELPVEAGDLYFFTTDGITRTIDDRDLERFLAADEPVERILRKIIAEALARGGPDNATAVLVRILAP